MHWRRQPLGRCLGGRLALGRNTKTAAIDVYLILRSSDPDPMIDANLRALIAASWTNLALATRRRLPTPRPLPVTNRPDWWWLCRLVPGTYVVESLHGGGSELFELEPARRRLFLRRPLT